jgi:hypothetical protein
MRYVRFRSGWDGWDEALMIAGLVMMIDYNR